jgi:hypothetical protein
MITICATRLEADIICIQDLFTGISSGQRTTARNKDFGSYMKRSIIIICFFVLACTIGSSVKTKNDRENRILVLLSRTEKAEDLEETVHSNRDFLEAVSLILHEAEKKNMREEEIKIYYISLLEKANWKKWIPWLTIKRVADDIYIVSVGSAAVTQSSSLYLFYNSSRLMIDRRDGGGAIDILSCELKGTKLKVIYRPEPGSTAIMTGSAYLEKRGNKWEIIEVTTKKEHP